MPQHDDLTPDDWQAHYRRLEFLYSVAPTNRYYKPRLSIEHEKATIEVDVDPNFFHAAHAVHGSVYFKMLDDAAFFAANSVVPGVFVLTASFNLQLFRPVTEGTLTAHGTLVNKSRRVVAAEAVLIDEKGRQLGRGGGTFMPTDLDLFKLEAGYREAGP
ncbi:hypothetical protein ABI59_10950 [Acidobacteria bacterium Mor1]|nr:hypothetical protein ABI59_10950 [Acidobacteria bacterium Mor1]